MGSFFSVPNPRGTLARDAVSGFLVFLIALPLCLGIAMASGFPPAAGVLTAVIGGLLGPFLGSARLTIKGPAAGLIVIVFGAVSELGGDDPVLGYRRALAVGVVAAGIQIVFALVRAAELGTMAPPAVVHGMLAAIGVIIVAKQAHFVLGVTPHAKEPLELLVEIPESVANNNPEIMLIGVASLVVLVAYPWMARKWLQKVPPQLVALLVAVPLGVYFDLDHQHEYNLFGHAHHLGPEYLLSLPGNLLDVITFPDFSVIATPASMKHVVMFTLVGSLESTLSLLAVDSLDPAKRASDTNRDMLAVGVGNLVSAALGGLPMISEIVRSKANIDAGAKSAWSNFFHGAFLLGFVVAVPELLRHIPLAALAAMLVYTGARLASPREVLHARALGRDQLFLFLTTLFVTLAVDLLVGIAAGILLKVVLHGARTRSVAALFRTRIEARRDGDRLVVAVEGPATFLALRKLRAALAQVDDSTRTVVLDLARATLVDHTFLERLHGMADEWTHAELDLLVGERLRPASEHPRASRTLVRSDEARA